MSMQLPQGALVPRIYVATKTFGLPGDPPVQIRVGTQLTFDGYSVSFHGFPSRPLPQLLGAIKVGWVVLQENYDPSAPEERPVAAGMQLRPTNGGNPMDPKPRMPVVTAQEEERHVGNVQQHATQVRQGNLTNYRTQPQGYTVLEPQEGIPVRHLGSPGRQGRNPVDMSREGEAAIRQANSTRVVPGVGRSRDEVLAAMDPEQRAAYEAEIATRKAFHGVLDYQVAVPPAVMVGPDTQGQVVGRVKSSQNSQTEGIATTQSVGGGIETVDLGGTGGQNETRTVMVEGIVLKETNGPRGGRPQAPPVAPPIDLDDQEDPRRVIARSVCADFPEIYNFDDSIRKKIARIQADFEDRSDIIRAIAAAEDLEMKAIMLQEFPGAFQV